MKQRVNSKHTQKAKQKTNKNKNCENSAEQKAKKRRMEKKKKKSKLNLNTPRLQAREMAQSCIMRHTVLQRKTARALSVPTRPKQQQTIREQTTTNTLPVQRHYPLKLKTATAANGFFSAIPIPSQINAIISTNPSGTTVPFCRVWLSITRQTVSKSTRVYVRTSRVKDEEDFRGVKKVES